MLYSILIYGPEDTLFNLSPQEDAEAIARHEPLIRKLSAQGRLGPVMRLMPTRAATTLRADREPFIVDGPFAETKEQLLGLYVVECETLDAAIEAAREIPRSCWRTLEIRPVSYYHPGAAAADAHQEAAIVRQA